LTEGSTFEKLPSTGCVMYYLRSFLAKL